MENFKALTAAAIAGTAIFSTNFIVAADEKPGLPPRAFHVPGAPPRFIANHVGSVGTAFSAAGHARADQIRVWADYQEALSRAALNNEIARQVYIESKLRVVRNRDELRAAHIEA